MQNKMTKRSIPSFQFDINLHKEYEFRYAVTNLKMKPAALIYFNKALGKLDWDRRVTKQSKNQVAQLKKQNNANKRAKFKNF